MIIILLSMPIATAATAACAPTAGRERSLQPGRGVDGQEDQGGTRGGPERRNLFLICRAGRPPTQDGRAEPAGGQPAVRDPGT